MCDMIRNNLQHTATKRKHVLRLLPFLILVATACAQKHTETKMEEQKEANNPLMCDPESGMCELPTYTPADTVSLLRAEKKALKIIYFTDPICSSCWGIEPQLRRLKLEYGADLEIEYRMGGLLPDWSYNSGGISKPSDVAHHWDEVSVYYDMPIDGDVWLEDPLHSSYPPSIAFKAAQLQDPEKAISFLRTIREMVFLEKKNITKWEHLATAAKANGLNPSQLKEDMDGKAKQLFDADLRFAKEMGVRGFPTLFFVDDSGKREMVYGSRPYAVYESALQLLFPDAEKFNYPHTAAFLFSVFPSLTAKEFSELSGTPRAESETILNRLVEEGALRKMNTKNGSIWILQPE